MSLQPLDEPKKISPRLSYSNVRWIREMLPCISSEVGGAIELYPDGKFARFTVYTAKPSEGAAQLTLDDSFQIEYHLHPDKSAVALPSLADMKAAYKKKIGYLAGQKGVTGQVNVVFAQEGVFVYRYTSTEKLAKSDFQSTMKEIRKIHLHGKDTPKGLRNQIRRIEEVSEKKFEIKYYEWEWLENKKGRPRCLPLGPLCLKEAVQHSDDANSRSMSFFLQQAKRWFSVV